MRLAQRRQAALQRFAQARLSLAQRLRHDRLDDGEGVLDAVRKLGRQQLPLLLSRLASGDVEEQAEEAPSLSRAQRTSNQRPSWEIWISKDCGSPVSTAIAQWSSSCCGTSLT